MRSLFLATLLLAWPADAREVRGSDPPFSVQIPDAFSPVRGTQEGVQVFVAPAPSGRVPCVITLRPLDGPISREGLDEATLRDMLRTMSPGASVRVLPADALGVDVPLVIGESGAHDALAFAQIPSTPRALQLLVTGPTSDAPLVERIARDAMRTFRASTNWLTRAEIQRRRIARILVVTAWAALATYGVAWAARFRRTTNVPLQRVLLVGTGLLFAAAAILLATVRRGASAFEPVTPALVALVLVVNAFLLRAAVRSDPSG